MNTAFWWRYMNIQSNSTVAPPSRSAHERPRTEFPCYTVFPFTATRGIPTLTAVNKEWRPVVVGLYWVFSASASIPSSILPISKGYSLFPGACGFAQQLALSEYTSSWRVPFSFSTSWLSWSFLTAYSKSKLTETVSISHLFVSDRSEQEMCETDMYPYRLTDVFI
jgi:hypothetical protein